MDIMQRRREVENQLAVLLRQVEGMDNKIRNYLADRQKNPHPRHEDLIEKIQRFRIDPSITTKYLETLLDNLQWKVYYYKNAWNQLWVNAEAKRREAFKQEQAAQAGPGHAENKGQAEDPFIYSVDRLWEVQKEKLARLGENAEPERKEDFVRRIKQSYGRLASEKKGSEDIFMTFDSSEKRCILEKRERGKTS